MELQAEVMLSGAPQRIDLVLRRRPGASRHNHKARMMHSLWPHLGQITLAEYKSPSRGYRRTDLLRLCGYGLQYFVHYHKDQNIRGREDLTLLLIVPRVGRALRSDAEFLQLSWETLSPPP